MKRPIVFLLCFASLFIFSLANVGADHEREKATDLAAFEAWFKDLLAERKDHLKVVPRIIREHDGSHSHSHSHSHNHDSYDFDIGMRATESLEAEDSLLEIPWHLMLTLEKIKLDHPDFKEVLDGHKLNIQEIFAIYLLYLKHCNPTSNFFAPWIKILPSKLNSILYFTPDEISLLKGSFLGSRALWRQQQSKANFEALAEIVFPSLPGNCPKFTYDHWKWAESVVESRTVDLINDGTDYVRFSAIVPYFDLFNHENSVNGVETWGYNSRKMVIHVEAGRDYNPSEQVFISYGTKCNDELLEKYGFIIEDNANQCVHMDINNIIHELDSDIAMNKQEGKDDDFLERKRLLIIEKAQGAHDYSFQILPTGVTEEVIFVAEISSYKIDDTVGEVSLNRIKWLINRVAHMLKGYPTTSEQDDGIIESTTFQRLSKRARLAILLRKEEKVLLQQVLDQYKEVESSILRKQEEKTIQVDENIGQDKKINKDEL